MKEGQVYKGEGMATVKERWLFGELDEDGDGTVAVRTTQ